MIALPQLRIGNPGMVPGLRLRLLHPATRHGSRPHVEPTAVERAERRARTSLRRDHLRIDGERLSYGLSRLH